MSNPSQYQQSFTPKVIRTNIDLDQQYVDHSYIDYANVERDNLCVIKEAASLADGSWSSGLGGSTRAKPSAISEKCNNTFPYKVGSPHHDMNIHTGWLVYWCNSSAYLQYVICMNSKSDTSYYFYCAQLHDILDLDDLSAIIDWMPHGRAFIVKRPKTIAAQVLTRFFKQTKLTSFTRQLNLWGFKRITRGTDSGAYYHELFLRGRPDLALRMKRYKIKGNGTRAIPCPEQEPNFYYNYPCIPRVPVSRVPMPLSYLPSERIANLKQGEDQLIFVMSPAFLYGSVPEANHPGGVVSPSMSMEAASNCYSSLDAERNSRLSAELGFEVDSSRYIHRVDSLPAAAAPQSFLSVNKGKTEDGELSYANRRLMERLAALAPAPDTYTQTTSFEPQQSSFTSTAADGYSGTSLYRANGFGGHWQGSRQSDRSQDVNFHTATRAMREVQPLEGSARRQQNNAEALTRYYMFLCNFES